MAYTSKPKTSVKNKPLAIKLILDARLCVVGVIVVAKRLNYWSSWRQIKGGHECPPYMFELVCTEYFTGKDTEDDVENNV
jgi:hypothetical protein